MVPHASYHNLRCLTKFFQERTFVHCSISYHGNPSPSLLHTLLTLALMTMPCSNQYLQELRIVPKRSKSKAPIGQRPIRLWQESGRDRQVVWVLLKPFRPTFEPTVPPEQDVATRETADASQNKGPAFEKFALPVVAGLRSARVQHVLEKRLGFRVASTPGFPRQVPQTAIEPGSPIGVGLMTGDVRIGFIGTTTLVKGNRVFAFGHPLLFSGPANLPLTEAVIFETARSEFDPFKVGDLGDIRGTVLQDRSAGIFARLDVAPDLVQLKFTVTDEDRSKTETINAQAVPLPDFLPTLTAIGALETFGRAMNRIGQGTAKWTWLLKRNKNLPYALAKNASTPLISLSL